MIDERRANLAYVVIGARPQAIIGRIAGALLLDGHVAAGDKLGQGLALHIGPQLASRAPCRRSCRTSGDPAAISETQPCMSRGFPIFEGGDVVVSEIVQPVFAL